MKLRGGRCAQWQMLPLLVLHSGFEHPKWDGRPGHRSTRGINDSVKRLVRKSTEPRTLLKAKLYYIEKNSWTSLLGFSLSPSRGIEGTECESLPILCYYDVTTSLVSFDQSVAVKISCRSRLYPLCGTCSVHGRYLTLGLDKNIQFQEIGVTRFK